MRFSFPCFLLLLSVSSILAIEEAKSTEDAFQCLVLNEEFYSEGADFADINGDGSHDVVSGPFWYEGPTFRNRRRYMPGEAISIKGYSKHFFSFTCDFNGDERPDILVIGMPGQPATWYENPGGDVATNGSWRQHHVLDDAGGESPTLVNLLGDDRPELICVHQGAFGYAKPNPNKPNESWKFTPIMKPRGLGIFTHGLGVGDVDGDGRLDILETEGWHRQLRDQSFEFHPQKFAQAGGSQMFAYDFDGDGDNDVLSVQNAHAWGLTWFERRGTGADVLWVPHEILKTSDSPDELSISQMHGVALEDMDGDGIKDIITGKRFFAHGGGDPGAFQPAVLYWFKTVRDKSGGARFEPNLIHQRIGVGTQLSTGDLNGDGRIDIVVGNKLGTFVVLNGLSSKRTSKNVAAAKSGTADFSRGVREDDPLSPEEELRTFVVPEGFEVQLVAAEPDINKPLNMAFDAKGRLWVTSTLEYPYPVEVGKPSRDSIKILEDTNGDGRADKVTTFADGLNIPIGLYPYKDGVICHSIPNIWFMRDTDGDGKCDKREVLYGPFDHSRDAHGMCNAFTRGFDGWLYACHGFNNHSKVAGRDGNLVSMQSGNTFRMRLDGSRIEHFTHGQVNPFGLHFDQRGDLFSADCHTKPVTLLLKDGRYESFGKPHDGLGFVPNVMEHLHGSTGIGGIAITGESASLPTAFHNNTFGGNVMTGRVNRNSLIYNGSSVQAREQPDFLVSGDSWFRPVDLQIGPDGALYVADFYNRIIGHYEVDLAHPGRDRERGRIWKVVYTGSKNRRDTNAKRTSEPAIDSLSPPELVEACSSDIPTRRMLATDRLVDHFGEASVEACRRGLTHTSANVRVHSLWALHRLGKITASQISQSIKDSDPIARSHVFRLIGEHTSASREQTAAWLFVGLRDKSPLVQRAAAIASTSHSVAETIPILMERWHSSPNEDVHLKHALRIALRAQLKDDTAFADTTQSVKSADVNLLADICLGLKTPAAGDFIAANMESLPKENKEKLTEYVQFSARYVSVEAVDNFVQLIRSHFDQNQQFQLELLRSLGSGFKQRSLTMPKPVTDWARDIATNLIEFEQTESPLPWTELRHPHAEESSFVETKTWKVSTKRNSDDGQQSSSLWSSFPNGEQRTGILRSSSFHLAKQFSFYLAGHDGYPPAEIQHKNIVRVRDVSSQVILKSWSPFRNDTARRVDWDTGELAGQRVQVELVDGDTADAYAWLAVGRFSDERLNPNDVVVNRRLGTEVVREFQLTDLRKSLTDLMLSPKADFHSRKLVANAIASFMPTASINAVLDAVAFANLPADLREAGFQLIVDRRDAFEFLNQSLKYATSIQQRELTEALASDRTGIGNLIKLVDSGTADVRHLSAPAVAAKLEAVGSAEQKASIEVRTRDLTVESESIASSIRDRISSFSKLGGDVKSGQTEFEKNCATCHQVNGKGKQIGPNLDGIGNRGLARITEDILAPNRNVDTAFHATTIVTDDGQAITGLAREAGDSDVLIIVDQVGKEQKIAKSKIDQQTKSRLSPMPANFGEVLKDEQFRNLLSYLLTLKK